MVMTTTGGTINIVSTPKSYYPNSFTFENEVKSKMKMNVDFNIIFKTKDFNKVNRILHSLTYSVDDNSFYLVYKDATYGYNCEGSIVENSIQSICYYFNDDFFVIQEKITEALKGIASIQNFRMYND
jgi:hypothetical protein